MESNGRGPRRAACRFVHAADLYLDAPVRGIALPPEPLRAAVRDASLRAWQSLVELVLERDAAFLILTGVLLADRPTLRARIALRDGLERLRARGIGVFIAVAGDAAAVESAPWLDGATVFPNDSVSSARVVRDGHGLATLYGRSGESDWPTTIDAIAPGPGVRIGLLGRLSERAEPNPPHAEIAYWGLGGPPSPARHENGTRPGSPWVISPGSPQGRSLEPAHLGPRGCVVVEVTEDRIANLTEVAVDHVRFVSLEVDVRRCADLAAIRRRLTRALADTAEDAAPRLVMAEGVLRGDLSNGIAADRLALETTLLADLRRDAASASDGAHAWWVRVRDASARPDHALAAGPWNLRRILVEHGDAVSAPLPGSRFLAQHFAPLLRQWDAESNLADHRELVRDATGVALDQLSDEGGA
jgi:hypothetical protein